MPGGGAGSCSRPPDTEPWSCHWNQWTLMKSKIPVTISMKIHANQAPATSFVYICLCCGYCGERSVRLNGLSPHFNCPYMCVCLFVFLCLFESILMFMLECMTTKETLGYSFINTEKTKLSDLPNLSHFATFQVWPYSTFQGTAPLCKP